MIITAIVKNYERFLQPKRALALASTDFSVQKPSSNFSMKYNLPAGDRLALRYLAISQHSLSVALLKQRIRWTKSKTNQLLITEVPSAAKLQSNVQKP